MKRLSLLVLPLFFSTCLSQAKFYEVKSFTESGTQNFCVDVKNFNPLPGDLTDDERRFWYKAAEIKVEFSVEFFVLNVFSSIVSIVEIPANLLTEGLHKMEIWNSLNNDQTHALNVKFDGVLQNGNSRDSKHASSKSDFKHIKIYAKGPLKFEWNSKCEGGKDFEVNQDVFPTEDPNVEKKSSTEGTTSTITTLRTSPRTTRVMANDSVSTRRTSTKTMSMSNEIMTTLRTSPKATSSMSNEIMTTLRTSPKATQVSVVTIESTTHEELGTDSSSPSTDMIFLDSSTPGFSSANGGLIIGGIAVLMIILTVMGIAIVMTYCKKSGSVDIQEVTYTPPVEMNFDYYSEVVIDAPPSPEIKLNIDSDVDNEETTGIVPEVEETTGIVPEVEETTGIVPEVEETTAIVPEVEETTGIVPEVEETAAIVPEVEETTGIVPEVEETTGIVMNAALVPDDELNTGQIEREKDTEV